LLDALSNLVNNAIKFAPVGGEVTIALKLCVLVEDRPSTPVRERGTVLQQFYRVEQTRHLPGTELGLGIASVIMRLHNFARRIGDEGQSAVVTIDCWPQDSQ
jgi:signal transduction histidine kinase